MPRHKTLLEPVRIIELSDAELSRVADMVARINGSYPMPDTKPQGYDEAVARNKSPDLMRNTHELLRNQLAEINRRLDDILHQLIGTTPTQQGLTPADAPQPYLSLRDLADESHVAASQAINKLDHIQTSLS